MSDREIVDEFWKSLKASPFVMIGLDGSHAHHEPMTAQFDDGTRGGPIWFYTSRDNRIVQGLEGKGQGRAMAQFAAKGHDLFACVDGTISTSNDRVIIDRFWSKAVEAWFEGGKADPNLILLRFEPTSAEIWQADLKLGTKMKMVFGGDIKREEVEGKHTETAL